jgi:type II secretory pathway component PulJ
MSTLALIGAALYVIISVVLMALVLYSLWATLKDQIERQRERYDHEEANQEVKR